MTRRDHNTRRRPSATITKSTPTNRQNQTEDRSAERPFWRKSLPFESETTWFLLLSCLDIFMTYLLLRHRQFTEANPIASFFLNRWGMKGMIYFKLFMVAVVATLAQIIATRKPETARRLLLFASIVVGGVVVYSTMLYVRHVQ